MLADRSRNLRALRDLRGPLESLALKLTNFRFLIILRGNSSRDSRLMYRNAIHNFIGFKVAANHTPRFRVRSIDPLAINRMFLQLTLVLY